MAKTLLAQRFRIVILGRHTTIVQSFSAEKEKHFIERHRHASRAMFVASTLHFDSLFHANILNMMLSIRIIARDKYLIAAEYMNINNALECFLLNFFISRFFAVVTW